MQEKEDAKEDAREDVRQEEKDVADEEKLPVKIYY